MHEDRPSKRSKPSPIQTTIVVPITDEFELQNVFSTSLLRIIYPNAEIVHVDIDTDNTLRDHARDANTFVIGCGIIGGPRVYDWSNHIHNPQVKQNGKQRNKQKQKQKLKQIQGKAGRLGIVEYFKDSKRCRVVPLCTVGKVYTIHGRDIVRRALEDANSELPMPSTQDLDWVYERAYFDYIEIIDADARRMPMYRVVKDGRGENVKRGDLPDARFSADQHTLREFVKRCGLQMEDFENVDWDVEKVKQLRQEKFCNVVDILKMGFENYVRYFAFSFLHGREVVANAFAKVVKENGKVLVLDDFVPWKEHLFNMEKANDKRVKVLYVVFPDSSKNWKVSAVPIQPASFDSRKKFPEQWCGLEGEKLAQVCGVDDATFVHAQGFIAGAKTKEGCLALANMAAAEKAEVQTKTGSSESRA
jgi:uncharacterized UPF0160 family protein